MKQFLKVKDFKYGTKVIVYWEKYISAWQIASCYWISWYPYLYLINKPEDTIKLRWLDLSKCIELRKLEKYPEIKFRVEKINT